MDPFFYHRRLETVLRLREMRIRGELVPAPWPGNQWPAGEPGPTGGVLCPPVSVSGVSGTTALGLCGLAWLAIPLLLYGAAVDATNGPVEFDENALFPILVWLILGIILAVMGSRFLVMRGFRVELSREPLARGETATVRIWRDGPGSSLITIALLERERIRQWGDRGGSWLHDRAIRERSLADGALVPTDGLLWEGPITIPEDADYSYDHPDYKVQWGIQLTVIKGLVTARELYTFRVHPPRETHV